MGDKNPKEPKGKVVLDHKIINQECIHHDPPRVRHPEVPIGFKFEPTDNELVSTYLKKKIGNSHQPSFIPETNIYDFLPQELLEGNKDEDSYFFTPRNKRYANGTSVKEGYGHWRNIGSQDEIKGVDGRITGYKNSLKFYIGMNKTDGKPTEWLMKEYVMCRDDKEKVGSSSSISNMRLDDYVICRVYLHKSAKCTESAAEIDGGGNVGNSTISTCNKKQKIEKEGKLSEGKAGIKIENHENGMILRRAPTNSSPTTI